MKTILISAAVAFLALWIGLESGYRIGYQSASIAATKKNQASFTFKVNQAYKVSKLTGAPLYQVLTGKKAN